MEKKTIMEVEDEDRNALIITEAGCGVPGGFVIQSFTLVYIEVFLK